jgi:hypothetical protein
MNYEPILLVAALIGIGVGVWLWMDGKDER